MIKCDKTKDSKLTSAEGPGQGHDEVAQVVGLAAQAPPAPHQELLARGSADGGHFCQVRENRMMVLKL